MAQLEEFNRLRQEWRDLYLNLLRTWGGETNGDGPVMTMEGLDRSVSEALIRSRTPGATSPSSVKKWRVAGPSGSLPSIPTSRTLDQMFDSGTRLEALRASIDQLDREGQGNGLANHHDNGFTLPTPAPSPAAPATATAAEASPRQPHSLMTAVAASTALVVCIVFAFLLGHAVQPPPAPPAPPSPPAPPPPPFALLPPNQVPGAAADTTLACSGEVGAVRTELANEAAAPDWRDGLRRAYESAGGNERVGCVTEPAHRWGNLILQTVARDRQPSGALLVVADDPRRSFWFNRSLWGSYFQIGGKDGSVAQSFAGTPKEILRFPDDHVEVSMSAGLILLAEHDEAPYFWIFHDYVDWWRGHPALGLPTSNPMPPGRQDFQHGYATVEMPALPEEHLVSTPALDLPAPNKLPGHILRQPDATSWYVTTDGKRQWIPDGGAFLCLGGRPQVVADNVPGYAIDTLTYAGLATCTNPGAPPAGPGGAGPGGTGPPPPPPPPPAP